MGGKEGSRGYLYQGIVAVLESLQKCDWDQIYIEFPTEGDKVDIALKYKGEITSAIQVKSTINSFQKKEVSTWIADIIKDYPCHQYKLVLIGNCGPSAMNFINAIDKYQAGKWDAKAQEALNGFDTSLFGGVKFETVLLPFNPDTLKSLAREALWGYVCERGYSLDRPQVALIVDAMIEDQLLQATDGGYTDRTVFDQELNGRIKLLLKKHTRERERIGIISFSRGAELVIEEVPILLDLREKFNGRVPKRGIDWNTDIHKSVHGFLRANTDQRQAFQIVLETHSSIAFAAGRIFDTKAGVDICPIQKTDTGPQLWDFDKTDKTCYQDWTIEHIAWDKNSLDSALILNVTHNIRCDVERYLTEQEIPIGRIINCTLEETGTTIFSIQNGTHATKLASTVYNALMGRDTPERRAYLHIFAAAPNAFMFRLGQVSRAFGKCLLYEYDLEQYGTCSYMPSICYDGKGEFE